MNCCGSLSDNNQEARYFEQVHISDFEPEEETMKVLALCTIVSLISFSAYAQQPDPVSVLTDELKSQVPPKWEVRVRWREQGRLLATITPWPY